MHSYKKESTNGKAKKKKKNECSTKKDKYS